MHTRTLLVEEGGFLYDSNSVNDDIPYFVDVSGKPFLVVPYTGTYNDARFLARLASPSDFVDECTRALEYVWREGSVAPRMMTIAVHARTSGEAGRASALREIVERAMSLPGVWIARRVDIARWCTERLLEQLRPQGSVPPK
jgi:hypothetical protein